MNTIEVCLTPELLKQHSVAEKVVVVVDVLRASSTMVTAFAHGLERLMPVAYVEGCLALQRLGYLSAGERDGAKVEGFNFGNSPYDVMDKSLEGKSLAMTTTNGTLAIERAKDARKLLIGTFLNMSAVVKYLQKLDEPVLVMCAGWKGYINLEDTLFAGALVSALKETHEIQGDSSLTAQLLYESSKDNLLEVVSQASHAQRLKDLSADKDMRYCLQIDEYDVVPVLESEHLVAHTV
uniref:Probable 2-phosphosulfolactate phosphatase n=1 Tax=Roseihalotalea indica TaxID=2867963 RepID=A0AA49JHH0_9BACT|nr:2-phosphosulfolactate phosphatase [Tunicatimonas sp. TK19036]